MSKVERITHEQYATRFDYLAYTAGPDLHVELIRAVATATATPPR